MSVVSVVAYRLSYTHPVEGVILLSLTAKMVECYSSSWETCHRATERRLPYEITQCYLPPDTGERAPP